MSFQSATTELAANLPGNWTCEQLHDGYAILTRDDGMRLGVHSRGWRVNVSADMPEIEGGRSWCPRDFGVDAETPKRTFDLRRMEGKSLRCAVETNTFVIRPWEEPWRACLAVRDKRMAERSDAQDIADAIARVLGVELTDGPLAKGCDAHARVYNGSGGISGDFRIQPFKGGSVEITLRSVPGWAAIRIAEALAALPKPNR